MLIRWRQKRHGRAQHSLHGIAASDCAATPGRQLWLIYFMNWSEWMRQWIFAASAALFLLSGCASGPFFWTRPDSDLTAFHRDHEVCFQTLSGKGYRNCLMSRGWTRVQTASGLPDESHFRGPESDEDFRAPKSQDEIADATKQEQALDQCRGTRDPVRSPMQASVVCP